MHNQWLFDLKNTAERYSISDYLSTSCMFGYSFDYLSHLILLLSSPLSISLSIIIIIDDRLTIFVENIPTDVSFEETTVLLHQHFEAICLSEKPNFPQPVVAIHLIPKYSQKVGVAVSISLSIHLSIYPYTIIKSA